MNWPLETSILLRRLIMWDVLDFADPVTSASQIKPGFVGKNHGWKGRENGKSKKSQVKLMNRNEREKKEIERK